MRASSNKTRISLSIKIIQLLIFTLVVFAYSQIKENNPSFSVKEKLNFPFGTLVKLKIEMIDGDNLRRKALQGAYLIKIIEVNDIKIEKPQIMEFADEVGEFPENDFTLYKFLYGKNVGSLSSDTIEKMKKKYVGKIFNVLAYESGKFIGIPNKSKYVEENINSFELIRQDTSFHFKNFIIITSKLNE